MGNAKVIYVFAPHPDDESLACGGTIIKRISQGYHVKIVLMTDGSHSHSTVLDIWSNPSPEELAEIRKKEFLSATNTLGIPTENLILLEVEDGFLHSVVEESAQKIARMLSVEQNEIVEIYVTHKKDHHRDHKATNTIVGKALRKLSLENTKIFQYIIWGRDEENDLGTNVEIDIREVLGQKIAAIGKYASQIELGIPGQERPILDAAFLRPFMNDRVETFWC